MTKGALAEAAETPATTGERLFGVLAYLCWMSPLYFLAPVALYLWKGKTSRFIGFHAVQSTLLAVAIGVATLAIYVPLIYLLGLGESRAAQAVATVAYVAVMVVTALLPLTSCLWMAGSVLLGRRAVLPVLGSLARQIIAPKANAAPRSAV
jgi:uncharacterized membrane protein